MSDSWSILGEKNASKLPLILFLIEHHLILIISIKVYCHPHHRPPHPILHCPLNRSPHCLHRLRSRLNVEYGSWCGNHQTYTHFLTSHFLHLLPESTLTGSFPDSLVEFPALTNSSLFSVPFPPLLPPVSIGKFYAFLSVAFSHSLRLTLPALSLSTLPPPIPPLSLLLPRYHFLLPLFFGPPKLVFLLTVTVFSFFRTFPELTSKIDFQGAHPPTAPGENIFSPS